MRKTAILLLVPAVLLAGCSGIIVRRDTPTEPPASAAAEPEPSLTATDDASEPVESEDYAALVTERFGDCLVDLGAGPLAFEAGGDGTSQLGFVFGEAQGTPLEWSVGTSNTGAVITVPDEATTTALEGVGC